MNKITNITRKAIFDILLNTYTNDYLIGNTQTRFIFWGIATPVEFLSRLYNLEQLPSINKKYKNAKDEINANSTSLYYNLEWLFKDDRFHLKNGSDEELLDFICTVIHPEIRDETINNLTEPLWDIVRYNLNNQISNDGYFLVYDGQISGHIVYSWIDRDKYSLQTLKGEDTSPFMNLFIRNGKILDFSSVDFNSFCKKILGFSLCPVYNSTKEKTFSQFVHEGRDEEVIKLLTALLDYYEDSEKFKNERSNDSHYYCIYKRCKKVISNFDSFNSVIDNSLCELSEDFSSNYMHSLIELMLDNQKSNPTEAIGKAKELIESCCKTILKERGIDISDTWNLSQYVRATQQALHILPCDIPDEESNVKALKGVLGNLSGLASNLATIRNSFGTGHGKDLDYIGLEERHAKLAIGSSVTLVKFLWDSHLIDRE